MVSIALTKLGMVDEGEGGRVGGLRAITLCSLLER